MKLPQPFVKLPIRIDIERLRQEVAAIPDGEWAQHPNAFHGNYAVRLISADGGENDRYTGHMAETPRLQQSPYIRQLLASFSVVWSRSRLMRVDGRCIVPEHSDIHYMWYDRIRIHIPVETDPAVRFHCDGQSVHMAAGEVWIFDNWRLHHVENNSERRRIHLVADTKGSSGFWSMVHAAIAGAAPAIDVRYRPQIRPPLYLERFNTYRVMPPGEVERLLRDLLDEAVSPTQDQRALQRLRLAVNAFIADWGQVWALFADDPTAAANYQRLIERLREQTLDLREALVARTNQVPIGRVLDARVLDYALDMQAGSALGTDQPAASQAASAAEAAPRRRPTTRRLHFDRPLFIVAAPRSGSTLLYETLSATPQLVGFHGEAHGWIEGVPALVPGAPGVDSNRLDASHAKPEICEQLMHMAEAELIRRNPELRLGAQPLPVRFLEKTPKNALRIPLLNSLFPDARFIFLWRRPQANISSIIDAWRSGGWVTYRQLPGWDGPWSLLLPPGWQALRGQSVAEVAAAQWALTNRSILADLQQLDATRHCALCYEDFVADPEAAVRRLCRFGDIAFDAALAARCAQQLPLSRHTLTPPEPDKWRKNAAEVEAVAHLYQSLEHFLLDAHKA